MLSNLLLKMRQLFTSQRILWLIFIFALACRVVQYASNRSLWLDEAALALKIDHFSFTQLLHPQNQLSESYFVHIQAGPFGLLALVKMLVIYFGDHEYVLRLVPFIAGVVSIFLF